MLGNMVVAASCHGDSFINIKLHTERNSVSFESIGFSLGVEVGAVHKCTPHFSDFVLLK